MSKINIYLEFQKNSDYQLSTIQEEIEDAINPYSIVGRYIKWLEKHYKK